MAVGKIVFTLIANVKQVVTDGEITIKGNKAPGYSFWDWDASTLPGFTSSANIFKHPNPPDGDHEVTVTVKDGHNKVVAKGTYTVTVKKGL